MPWLTLTPMLHFRVCAGRAASPRRTGVKSLCAQFGVQEKTGHKWLGRYAAAGPDALADRSHAPVVPAHRYPDVRISGTPPPRPTYRSFRSTTLPIIPSKPPTPDLQVIIRATLSDCRAVRHALLYRKQSVLSGPLQRRCSNSGTATPPAARPAPPAGPRHWPGRDPRAARTPPRQ